MLAWYVTNNVNRKKGNNMFRIDFNSEYPKNFEGAKLIKTFERKVRAE